MAKVFSLASWNVEHFKDDPDRINRVVDFLVAPQGGNRPDVFGLYEVEGKQVYDALVSKMPGYTFHITEGPQTQEILVGVKSNFTAFFTQKLEFKSGNKSLRPGALLALHIGNKNYSILFLHTKSGASPLGLGLRDDMFDRALKFRRTIEKAANATQWSSKYLFLGDLNTMGMPYPFDREIDAPTELRKLDGQASRRHMRRLTKSAPATWSNGSSSSIPPSDLDQVVASSNISFRQFGGADVDVRGWASQSTNSQMDNWIKRYSDHSLLYMEVQQP
jgi:hypothetical protein